jgi:hypothetical protein
VTACLLAMWLSTFERCFFALSTVTICFIVKILNSKYLQNISTTFL